MIVSVKQHKGQKHDTMRYEQNVREIIWMLADLVPNLDRITSAREESRAKNLYQQN
jgi:hypothetical protein